MHWVECPNCENPWCMKHWKHAFECECCDHVWETLDDGSQICFECDEKRGKDVV